jgi:hypothetical protein
VRGGTHGFAFLVAPRALDPNDRLLRGDASGHARDCRGDDDDDHQGEKGEGERESRSHDEWEVFDEIFFSFAKHHETPTQRSTNSGERERGTHVSSNRKAR